MSKAPCTSFWSDTTPSPHTLSGGLPWEEDWDILEDPEGEGDDGADDPTKEDPSPPEGKQSAALQKEIARLREANRRLKERETAAAEAARLQQEAAAAEQGKFKELWEAEKKGRLDLEGRFKELSAREQARMERLTESNAAAIKALPEGLRALIPEGLDPEATAAQIARIRATLANEGPDGGVIAKPPKRTEEKIPDACVKQAERMGITDVRNFYERVWKPKMERQAGKR